MQNALTATKAVALKNANCLCIVVLLETKPVMAPSQVHASIEDGTGA
jgi:hypothetical protein